MNVYKAIIPSTSAVLGILIVAANTKKEASKKVKAYYARHGFGKNYYTEGGVYKKLPNTEYSGKTPKVISTYFYDGIGDM